MRWGWICNLFGLTLYLNVFQVYAPSSHSFQSILTGATRRFSSMESTSASAVAFQELNRCALTPPRLLQLLTAILLSTCSSLARAIGSVTHKALKPGFGNPIHPSLFTRDSRSLRGCLITQDSMEVKAFLTLFECRKSCLALANG